MDTPRALSLDLDGTLYDMPRARALYGLRFPHGIRFALASARARKQLLGGGEVQAPWLELLGEEFGWASDRILAAENKHQDRLERVLRHLGPPRGLHELLNEFGCPVVVFSDVPTQGKLAALGLTDVCTAQVNAWDLDCLKPHPRGFAAVADTLGLPPKDILHVGDRYDTDGEGAEAAGFQFAYGPARDLVGLLRRSFSLK